jgi:hypothetical protein
MRTVEHTTAFRYLRASWGIAVDVVGYFDSDEVPGALPVVDGLDVVLPAGLSVGERATAVARLRQHAAAIRWRTVVISGLRHNMCDVQDEGVGWALDRWLREQIDTAVPEPRIVWDTVGRRYREVGQDG